MTVFHVLGNPNRAALIFQREDLGGIWKKSVFKAVNCLDLRLTMKRLISLSVPQGGSGCYFQQLEVRNHQRSFVMFLITWVGAALEDTAHQTPGIVAGLTPIRHRQRRASQFGSKQQQNDGERINHHVGSRGKYI